MPADESKRVFDLASFARHRSWCPEADGPGDCTCGLYALLDSFRCSCGHKVSIHTTRDVSDVVGWPCNECRSDRCRGFRLAESPPATPPASPGGEVDGVSLPITVRLSLAQMGTWSPSRISRFFSGVATMLYAINDEADRWDR